MFTPASITLIAGLALIVVGLFGGGIEVKEIKIPQLPMFPRAASFLIGCILTTLVFFDQNLFLPSQTDKRDDLGTAITNHLIDVRDVKMVLKQLGMYRGPINNGPDPAYFQAVANFQQSRNIGQDGLVDGGTYGKLREAWPEFFGQQQSAPARTAGPPSPNAPTQTAGSPTSPQTASPLAQTAGSHTPESGIPKQAEGPSPSDTETEVTPLCKIQPNHKARPSPGVNCTATGTPDEVEICGNAGLCELDWQLYSFYQVAKARLDNNQQSKLAKDEIAWVKKRGECRSDGRCIAAAYKSRIDQLR
jgi:uncharacterized protein YecT (DUF1311 family)